MDFESHKKKVTSKEELEAYIKTLPYGVREEAEKMMVNIEPRIILAKALVGLLEALTDKYPSMKSDSMTTLIILASMSATTNIDSIILSTLQEAGVLEVITKIIEEKKKFEQEEEDKDKTGDSTISDILKNFKLSDN